MGLGAGGGRLADCHHLGNNALLLLLRLVIVAMLSLLLIIIIICVLLVISAVVALLVVLLVRPKAQVLGRLPPVGRAWACPGVGSGAWSGAGARSVVAIKCGNAACCTRRRLGGQPARWQQGRA